MMKIIVLDNDNLALDGLENHDKGYSVKRVKTLECLIKEFSRQEYHFLVYNSQSDIISNSLLSQFVSALKCSPQICIITHSETLSDNSNISHFKSIADINRYLENYQKNLFLRICTEKNELFLDSQVIKLTSIEIKILELFKNKPNTVISKEEIELYVWGEGIIKVRNTLATHLRNLKLKIPQLNENLTNIRGKGYIYRTEN